MVEYSADGLTAFYGGYKFRKDKKTGYFLCSKKTNVGKRERLHCFVWRSETGRIIPKGYAVHHIDGDKNNNDFSNLALMSKESHAKLHGTTWSEERIIKQRAILKEKCVPASKAWHKSEEGRKWHTDHYKESLGKEEVFNYKCLYCGDSFNSKHKYSKNQSTFCCNNCRAAYRRKAGIDDITKICKACGKEYQSNKYTKSSRCPGCRNRRNKADRQG